MTKQTVGEVASDLEGLGYVERVPDPAAQPPQSNTTHYAAINCTRVRRPSTREAERDRSGRRNERSGTRSSRMAARDTILYQQAIFGAIAEFERQLIRERTQAGLQAARARGRLGGRRSVITEEKLRVAREMLAAGNTPCSRSPRRSASAAQRCIATSITHARARHSHLIILAAALPASAQLALAAGEPAAPPAQQREPVARSTQKKTARSPGLPRRRGSLGLVADRRLWLQETCPACQASPGARCRDHRGGKTRRLTTELHFARGWRQRRCPTCRAEPGRAVLHAPRPTRSTSPQRPPAS